MASYSEIIDICCSFENHIFLLNEEKGILRSESWSNGGTWCDCWGNTSHIHAESPQEFSTLDDLLYRICPNLTFLQYKHIKKNCVKLINYTDRDYYGGSEAKSYWECDLHKLYEELTNVLS